MTDAAESTNTNQRMETACKEECKRSILRAMPPWLQQVQLSKETALQEEVKRLREERDELREELNCARNDAEQAA